MREADFSPIEGNQVWYGPDLAEREEYWTYRLSADDIAALDDAIARITAHDIDVIDITRDLFPLPGLGDTLRRIEVDLQKGLGLSLIHI